MIKLSKVGSENTIEKYTYIFEIVQKVECAIFVMQIITAMDYSGFIHSQQ